MKQQNESSIEPSSDDRREQIKNAALKVFARRGIDRTKMSMIAVEAGISQGLSYRYFSSKEEIFTILVQEAIDEAQAAIRNVRHLPGSPKEQLKIFTLNMMDESHKYYFLLLQHAQTSDEAPVMAKQIIEQYSSGETIEQLVPLFIKGQQMSEFREGDPHKLLFLYFSVIIGLMLQNIPLSQDYLQQEIDSLLKIILK
ncbi:AcrR family transcriptional regulator [Paenibacillus castaneae]|nr:TetR/AcrR family transcriptional regulator [Paenibacillus castaneae]NIK77282.1 AcrR family transcriptional regulator [Paenibacillus castaneae]